MTKPTFREMEKHTYEIVLASEVNVEPNVSRWFVAQFRLGYYTTYLVIDHGIEVFRSDNWREALIEFNHGDVAATMDEAQGVTK